MQTMKTSLLSLALVLVAVSPTLAVDTAKTYTSGILILLFVGFCALLIVAQLVPALLALFGLTRQAARASSGHKQTAAVRKHSH